MAYSIPKMRTRELTLIELTAELDALTRLMEQYCSHHAKFEDERDNRYETKFTAAERAVAAALSAAKELSTATATASNQAIIKAEEAQTAYNLAHNQTIPRPEAEARFKTIEGEIKQLRETMASGGGREVGVKQVKDESRANIAIIVSVIVGFLSFVGVAVTIITVLRN